MSTDGGFITLHRSIRKHPYWEDPERLKAWIDVLFMAAWKDYRVMVDHRQVTLKRGEFLASDRFLAKRWGWSTGKVRRWIETAREVGEIRTTNRTTNGTIYAVVKYDTYQITTSANEPATNQPRTGDEPLTNRPRTKEKKGKKVKKVKTSIPSDWKPNEKHQEIAASEGVDLEREAANFCDHAEANGRTMLNWDACFNTWLRKASGFAGKGNGVTPDFGDESKRDADRRHEQRARQSRTEADAIDAEVAATDKRNEAAVAWFATLDAERKQEIRDAIEERAKIIEPRRKKFTKLNLQGCLNAIHAENGAGA